jgi:hypothetical protein
LNEDGKRDDGEADGNDLLALRDFGWKPKGQGKRHRPSQAAPKQDVLMFHGHAIRGAQEQKAAGVDGDRPAERHQRIGVARLNVPASLPLEGEV